MPSQLFPPTAAILALAGAALGVYLGNGAIAEINPAHFAADERAASRFYANLTPQGYSDWSQVQAAEFRAAQMGTDLGTGCVGCRTYPEEYYPVHQASLGKSRTLWVEAVEAQVAAAAEPVPPPAPDPAVQEVERYAAFPVTEEEQSEQLAMAEAPAAPAAVEEVAAD